MPLGGLVVEPKTHSEIPPRDMSVTEDAFRVAKRSELC